MPDSKELMKKLYQHVVVYGGNIIKPREGYMLEVREVMIVPGNGHAVPLHDG